MCYRIYILAPYRDKKKKKKKERKKRHLFIVLAVHLLRRHDSFGNTYTQDRKENSKSRIKGDLRPAMGITSGKSRYVSNVVIATA